MKSNQHVQVPDMELSTSGLKHIDPYIYACIKKFANSSTNSCYPSMVSLEKISGCKRKKIESSISRLEAAGYITVTRKFGYSNKYTFNEYKKFEIFSFDFLEDTRLTPKEKAYIIMSQQYMYKKPDLNKGLITYSSMELSDKLGLSQPSLRSIEKSLQEKNVLQLVPINVRDENTGLSNYMRIYNFDEFLNLLALKFKQTDETLEQHEKKIEDLEKSFNLLLEYVKKLEEKVNPPATITI